jgi:Transposase.
LTLFKCNPKEFLHHFVTINETLIHWYTPETKEQSKQWTSPGERALKKANTVLSAGKVLATVFWDSQGVIFINYLEKGKAVTGLYYAKLLGRFDAELQKKDPIWQRKKCSSTMTMH